MSGNNDAIRTFTDDFVDSVSGRVDRGSEKVSEKSITSCSTLCRGLRRRHGNKGFSRGRRRVEDWRGELGRVSKRGILCKWDQKEDNMEKRSWSAGVAGIVGQLRG